MSRVLKIITNPNPILRKKSKLIEVKKISSSEMKKLALDMVKTMEASDGIGISAPQIGKNIRLIIVNAKDRPLVMFNPQITKKSWTKEIDEEGCLSVPGVFGEVKRHKKINCIYINENGKKIKLNTEGLMARVIQHETDHLDGILFIDKAKNTKTQKQ